VQRGEGERGGLAGAGLGDAQEIAPFQQRGIDWRWIGVGSL
jgi:hypothetical protein